MGCLIRVKGLLIWSIHVITNVNDFQFLRKASKTIYPFFYDIVCFNDGPRNMVEPFFFNLKVPKFIVYKTK